MKTFFAALLFFSIAFAVNGQITFQKTYGGNYLDFGHSVQQTTDGGYMLFGQTQSFGNGGRDMYLVKTDSLGNEQWYQTYGGPDWEYGISALQTTDGGYMLCGAYSGLSNDSLALIKTDSVGNVVWNKRFSGTTDRDVGQFVQQTTDGGFVAVGFTGPAFTEDIYVVKTDPSGNEEWNKVYNSTGRENAVGVRQTSDGGFAIIGETNSKGHGGIDMYLIKTDSSGDTTWTRTYGTPNDEMGRSLFITSDKGYILLGYENFPGGNLYLVKTDSSGNEQWSNYFGGPGWDFGNSVQQTTDGGFILAGRKENTTLGTNDMYCVKTDSSGTVVWEQTFPLGIMSDANSVQQTTDGGYILLGSTSDTVGVFDSNMYLVKIDANGLISVDENDRLSFNVIAYPNPFTEYTSLELPDPKNRNYALTIVSSQGKIIRKIKNIKTGTIRIHREDLARGLYFYQLVSEGKTVASGRLVVN